MKNVLYNIKRGIQNIVNWFPIIWKDEDFDDYYFHKIMLHKLKNMEKLFSSNYAWSEQSKRDANNIRYAINLLERITNDVYLEEAMKVFYEKYPNYEYNFHFEIDKNNPKLKILVDNDSQEQRDLKFECYKHADELEKNDYDKLYSFLNEHIREWWN